MLCSLKFLYLKISFDIANELLILSLIFPFNLLQCYYEYTVYIHLERYTNLSKYKIV